MNVKNPFTDLALGIGFCATTFVLLTSTATQAVNSYPLEVFPPEHKRMADPKTGVELLFLTTAPQNDSNLYFHEYSWLADESVIKINLKNGKLSEVCRLPQPPGFAGHVQWSRTNPNLLSFAGAHGPNGDVAGPAHASAGPEDYAARGKRLWVADIRNGVPRNVYLAVAAPQPCDFFVTT